jgi:two-component system phosphate regulon sensor histidine kinase PhoR
MKADKRKLPWLSRIALFNLVYVKDKDRIQQIVENLLVNSIKYGKAKGLTEVAVINLTKVLVRISDNGEGIEQQNIPRLLNAFIE